MRLQNLENVRVIIRDDTDFLGGWLSPEQKTFITTQYRLSLPGFHTPSTLYHSSSAFVPKMIIYALDDIRIRAKDLRFSAEVASREDWSPNLLGLLSPALRTLRITVMAEEVLLPPSQSSQDDDSLPFLRAVASMSGLQDLALTLDGANSPLSSFDYYTDCEAMAHNVFRAVNPGLRHFALEGDGSFDEANLVSFVAKQGPTLRSLILYGSILNGDWQSALRSIARLTKPSLRYISLHFPLYASPVLLHRDKRDAKALGFECATELAPYD